MESVWLPIFLFAATSSLLSVAMVTISYLVGPHRQGAVKEMPYESGMDPIHDARRRFDVRFHLVAIAFLVFDVELLFLYPWAVAKQNAAGLKAAVDEGLVSSTGLIFGEVLVFIALLALGFAYAWRKGVFQWR